MLGYLTVQPVNIVGIEMKKDEKMKCRHLIANDTCCMATKRVFSIWKIMAVDEETHLFLHQRCSIQLIENLVNEMLRGNQNKSRLAILRNVMHPFIISRHISLYHINHKTVRPNKWHYGLKLSQVTCKSIMYTTVARKKTDSCSKGIASKTPPPKLSTHVYCTSKMPLEQLRLRSPMLFWSPVRKTVL